MSLRITATDAAILGMLAKSGELSGYDLQRHAGGASTGFFWAPTKSRIYAVLPQLEARGFATSREVVQSGRPNKQLYRITKAGREALQTWLEEPPVFEPEKAPLLLKLYLGELVDPQILVSHVQKVRRDATDLKRKLEAAGPAENEYAELTVRQGLEWARAMIRWAAAAEQALAERAPAAAAAS